MWPLFILLMMRLGVHATALDDFPRARAKIGNHIIDVYLADTERRRERGLMFVEKLGADSGMLFVFDRAERLGFWMKNTLIPLDIGFFDDACTLSEIKPMAVEPSVLSANLTTYRSRERARFALEMNSGYFEKHGVSVSARLKVLSPVPPKSTLALCK